METSDHVQLPITEQELENLIDKTTTQFEVPNCDETQEAIAVAIMHLPPNQATAPLAHFGAAAIRRLAQEVAYKKIRTFDEKRKAKETAEKAALTLVGKEATPASVEPLQNA